MSGQARTLLRFGRPPPRRREILRDPKTFLPRPPTKIKVYDFSPSRVEDHYYATVQEDVMYMTYKHELGPRPPPREIRRQFDPDDPYTKFRENPTIGGARLGSRKLPPDTADNVIRLEKIQLHTMVKEAITDRSVLLSAIMAFRAIAGETFQGGGQHAVEGVQVIKARSNVGGWIRPGVPIGVKVDLKGKAMYDFLGTLVDFVLPRVRGFEGVPLPPANARWDTASSISGVVSFGLPPHAMSLFPQIEVNADQYPKFYGMHVHFVTNATGVGAQARAQALLSGFQVPFTRTKT